MNEPQAIDKDAQTFQRLGIAAMKVVYDPAVSKGLVQMMQGQEPPQAIAMAASTVLEKLKEQVKGIAPNAVYAVAPSVVMFVTELGGAAGLFKPSAGLVKQATEALQAQMQEAPKPEQAPAQPAGLIGGQPQMAGA